VDPAQSGGDLARAIVAAVASCDAVVLLIGHHWLAVAGEGLHDPNDHVRLELESALARGVLVIPVLIDGARMPVDGELPPSLASMAGQPALELSPNHPEADAARLLQVLDQSIAERQATQFTPAHGQSTAPRPSAPGQAPHPTKPMPPRRRPRTRTVALVAGGIVAAGAIAFVLIPPSHPAPSAQAGSRQGSAPKAVSSSSPAASPAASSTVLVTDDFSTQKINWTDDYHPAAGAYTGSGAYRLSVTGANGQAELARPAGATHGLGDVTPLSLSVSVDARKLTGAPQGYGYGIALRSDGSGDSYAFLVMDHAVAIQKWVGGGARVTGTPAPVNTSALHTGAADRLQAVCQTAADGKSVHLELWLNGTKLVDFTDRDHPYTKGYMGLYVETISDASSTAGAEFDNFTAAQL